MRNFLWEIGKFQGLCRCMDLKLLHNKVSYQAMSTLRSSLLSATANRKFFTISGNCLLLLLAVALCLPACDSAPPPLDAETRFRIDSLVNVQIAQAQKEHDSLCKAANMTQLPLLIDSIKKIRVREIEEQLKTVPK